MKAYLHPDAQHFLSHTELFRLKEIVRTNFISSIANSVATGSRTYKESFWWSVTHEDEVVGIAIRTAPFGYVFSPMPEDAVKYLMEEILVKDSTALEFAGPKKVINQVERCIGRDALEDEGELVYELKQLIEPETTGEIRLARESDYKLIYSWVLEFVQETEIQAFNLESVVKTNIQKGLNYLLEIDGQVVSFGGFHTPIEILGRKIGRVGPIFTPKEFRKNGYASLITSFITRILINEGAIVTLYTQAENPTSNKIYQNLGFLKIDENRRVKFN